MPRSLRFPLGAALSLLAACSKAEPPVDAPIGTYLAGYPNVDWRRR